MRAIQRILPLGFVLLLLHAAALAEPGVDWTQVLPNGFWHAPSGHGSVAYEGKIWVIGGIESLASFSSDGLDWKSVYAKERGSHGTVVFQDRIWVMGGLNRDFICFNDVQYLTAEQTWVTATPAAPWKKRFGHSAVVHNGQLWVLGGYHVENEEREHLNDIWSSSDGSSWTLVMASAPWLQRVYHTSLVYDGCIWVMGGRRISGDGFLNDVWCSPDGSSWTLTTAAAPWLPRSEFASFLYDGKMWILGGRGLNGTSPILFDDVWYSTDGTSWTRTTASAFHGGRSGHTVVVYNNELWLVGKGSGNYYDYGVWHSTDTVRWTMIPGGRWEQRFGLGTLSLNKRLWVVGGYSVDGRGNNDVWSSVDGVNWICDLYTAPWRWRSFHSSLVHNNKMWILGGSDGRKWMNNVWYSSNGTSWTCATASAEWTSRSMAAAVSFKGKIWLLGGGGGMNDIWCSADGASWTRVLEHAPWSPRFGHSALVFKDKIWIMGKASASFTEPGDVWSSPDGVNWTLVTDQAPWPTRNNHAAAVWGGRMWIMGGSAPYSMSYADIWYSYDGAQWYLATPYAPWEDRQGHAAVVHAGRLWVLGGIIHSSRAGNSEIMNDVWYTEDAVTAVPNWRRY